MSVRFVWNDSALRAAAKAAYRLGIAESAVFARGKAQWRHVAATIRPGADGVVIDSPHAKLLEGGARPHTISPSGGGPARVLRFKDGGFASGAVSHPGFRGSPFMGPTRDAWPSIFNDAARRTFPKASL